MANQFVCVLAETYGLRIYMRLCCHLAISQSLIGKVYIIFTSEIFSLWYFNNCSDSILIFS